MNFFVTAMLLSVASSTAANTTSTRRTSSLLRGGTQNTADTGTHHWNRRLLDNVILPIAVGDITLFAGNYVSAGPTGDEGPATAAGISVDGLAMDYTRGIVYMAGGTVR